MGAVIPIDQTITGPRGNCFSACIASLLEIPVQWVPRFINEDGDAPGDWTRRLDGWLQHHGLYALHFTRTPSREPWVAPGCLYILGGTSPRGRPHAVVARGHEIVHDPHPDKTGLLDVDGYVLLVPRWE